MTTTSDSFRQIQLWSQYHRALGVSLFYLFVDGQVSWGLGFTKDLYKITPRSSDVLISAVLLSTQWLSARVGGQPLLQMSRF